MVIQYLASMPIKLMHDFVIAIQNLITINIISSGAFVPVNIELIESAVIVLDVFHWVNKTFREKKNQIEKKEFYNDAVNNNLRLKSQMKEWAKQTKI